MPRLEHGVDPKIDNINRLVSDVLCGDVEGVDALLTIFKPLILKICKKWSVYFNDADHKMIPFDDLVCHAQYWFYEYTIHKYVADGKATYNKFIKDHIDQRIRYIYEQEINYRKKHIFPDPDRNRDVPDCDKHEMLEDVIYRYSDNGNHVNIEDDYIDKETTHNRNMLASSILHLLSDRRYFNEREEKIFIECTCNGRTHEDMSKLLGISRTRVSQIIGRTKDKLRINMYEHRGVRRLISKCK